MSVGYYESWSYNRTCDAWVPERIESGLWTHINFAFALIGPDHRIAQMNSFDTELYPRVTGIKASDPKLKVYISVGGWAAGGKTFSDMVATFESRSAFIESALAFMMLYVFDGIDIDWEYPAAEDRGGSPADTANLVMFMKELRAAFGADYGITMTLPSSYWYLRGFDVAGMQQYVDWVGSPRDFHQQGLTELAVQLHVVRYAWYVKSNI